MADISKTFYYKHADLADIADTTKTFCTVELSRPIARNLGLGFFSQKKWTFTCDYTKLMVVHAEPTFMKAHHFAVQQKYLKSITCPYPDLHTAVYAAYFLFA